MVYLLNKGGDRMTYLVEPQKNGCKKNSRLLLNCDYGGGGCGWLCSPHCMTQSFHCMCPARSGDAPISIEIGSSE